MDTVTKINQEHIMFWKEECEKLKEENKKLKEERKWADGLTARQVHEMFLSKEDILKELEKARKANTENFAGMCEEAKKNEKLKEENMKLKKQKEGLEKYIKGMEDSQRIKDLKAEIEYYRDENQYHEDEVNEWKNACIGILDKPQDINDVDPDLVEAWIEDMKMERDNLEEKIEQIKEHVERFGSLMED